MLQFNQRIFNFSFSSKFHQNLSHTMQVTQQNNSKQFTRDLQPDLSIAHALESGTADIWVIIVRRLTLAGETSFASA